MNPKIIKVVKVSDLRLDKNNKEYRTIEFETSNYKIITSEDTGENIKVRIEPRRNKLNVWQESYVNGEPSFGYDYQIGEFVMGDIITANVEEYQIPTKTEPYKTSIYTCIVLGDSTKDNWNKKIERTFENNNKIIVIPKHISLTGVNVNYKLNK